MAACESNAIGGPIGASFKMLPVMCPSRAVQTTSSTGGIDFVQIIKIVVKNLKNICINVLQS